MSKKGKKGKWKQVDLMTLLPDSQPALAKAQWCDEVDDENKEFSGPVRKPVLPTAPRSVRGTDDERVPMEGPYMAYVTNIPFEVEEVDIAEFFGDLEITSIQLPKNLDTAKLKGFGYVEFANRSGLINALSMSDTSLKGRRVRIEVSDNNDRRGMDRMGRNRMGLGRDRDDDGPDRTLGDWRSGPRAELPNEERDRFRSGARGGDFGGGGFRDREKDSFGAPRETDTKEGGWREGMGSGSSGASERFSDRDRDSYRSREGFGDRGFGERRPYADREREGYDRERGRPFGDRERDGYSDRGRYGDGPPREDRYSRDGPASESGEPKARPKLQLQPRSRPVETPAPVKEVAPEPAAAAAAPPAPRPSIFGAAKPVDTAARERQIEERLAKERDRPKPDMEPRSKESSEHGDEPRSSKKVEPAPPPKQNAWTRRPRIENEGNNGESVRDDEYDERQTSPSRHSKDEKEGQEDYRSDRRENYRAEDNHEEDQRGDHKDDNRDDYRNRRDGYGHNKDHKDYDSKQDYGREGGYKDGHSSYRDSDNGRGSYRDSDSGRGGHRDSEASRPHREESGRGSSNAVKDNSSHDGEYDRSKDDHGSATDRPPCREHSDDQPRMPKYEEKQVPNFAGSNKYAYLHEDDEREGVSD